MPDPVKYGSLPFDEAIDFFRQKVNLPTKTWTDLWQGMHARAFVVAGATTNELLSDFRGAIDKAISQGTTLEEFRKDFDTIVDKHGWSYNGSRGWRTRVIYETNLRTAHSVGRYKQLSDPAMLKRRPFWKYIHGDSITPRPQHLAWDGLTLPADDPWWDTHYPPNGWGCSCTVQAVNQRDLERDGKTSPDTAPADGSQPVDVPGVGTVSVPDGVDPGWGYNPGEAAWGKQLAEQTMAKWQAARKEAWEKLSPGDAATNGRPEKIPLDSSSTELGPSASSPDEMVALMTKVLGAPERVFELSQGAFKMGVNVNAEAVGKHLPLERAKWLPFLLDVMEKPFEVWASFERHKGTGQVVLRYRFIKAVEQDKKPLLMIVNVMNGQLEAYTFIPAGTMSYLNKERHGKLVFGRD